MDVGEAGLVGEISKLLARVEDELEFGEEGLGVEPYAAVEGDEVSVEVVEDFDAATLFGEEDSEAAGEGLNVADMFRNEWKDVVEEAGFASRPSDGGTVGGFN